MNRATGMLEAFPGEGATQHLKVAINGCATSSHLDAEHVVFLRAVAETDDIRDTTAADNVEHDHVLRDFHGVVEVEQQRADNDRQGGGSGGNGGGEHKGRRQVAVGGCVVLRDQGRQAPVVLAPLGHVDGSLVEVGDRCPVRPVPSCRIGA